MSLVRPLIAALGLSAFSALAQAAGPFQSELLHLDLPQLSASAPARMTANPAPRAEAQPAARVEIQAAGRTRAEVLAELREARARGELDHAAAEIGLLPALRPQLQDAATRLAAGTAPARR